MVVLNHTQTIPMPMPRSLPLRPRPEAIRGGFENQTSNGSIMSAYRKTGLSDAEWHTFWNEWLIFWNYSPSQNVDKMSRNCDKLSRNCDNLPWPKPFCPEMLIMCPIILIMCPEIMIKNPASLLRMIGSFACQLTVFRLFCCWNFTHIIQTNTKRHNRHLRGMTVEVMRWKVTRARWKSGRIIVRAGLFLVMKSLTLVFSWWKECCSVLILLRRYRFVPRVSQRTTPSFQ